MAAVRMWGLKTALANGCMGFERWVMLRFVSILLLLLSGIVPCAEAVTRPPGVEGGFSSLTSAQIDAIIQPIVYPVVGPQATTGYVGISAGFLDSNGWTFRGYGSTTYGGTTAPTVDTVFEIGSISKTFTGILYADSVARGLLPSPVSAPGTLAQPYVPAGITMPSRDGAQITLQNLLTHHAGLPHGPPPPYPQEPATTLAEWVGVNTAPATVGIPQLTTILNNYAPTNPANPLPYKPGESFHYSDTGAGLAAVIATQANNQTYSSLLASRITGKLGMDSTAIINTPDMQARYAEGYDQFGPSKPFIPAYNPAIQCTDDDSSIYTGAEAIRSSTNDMLLYAAANVGLTTVDPELLAAIELSRLALAESDVGHIGFFWFLFDSLGDGSVIGHSGAMSGYASILLLSPQHKKAVILMANTFDANNGIELAAAQLMLAMIPEPAGAPVACALASVLLCLGLRRRLFSGSAG